jgi:hypothetical protein
VQGAKWKGKDDLCQRMDRDIKEEEAKLEKLDRELQAWWRK